MKYYLLEGNNKKEITDNYTWFTINNYIMDYINNEEDLSNAIHDIIKLSNNTQLTINKINKKSIILSRS